MSGLRGRCNGLADYTRVDTGLFPGGAVESGMARGVLRLGDARVAVREKREKVYARQKNTHTVGERIER